MHNFTRDRRADAQRGAILEQTKLRIDIWKSPVEVQLYTSSGEDLQQAKAEVNLALKRILEEATNLAIVAARRSDHSPL